MDFDTVEAAYARDYKFRIANSNPIMATRSKLTVT